MGFGEVPGGAGYNLLVMVRAVLVCAWMLGLIGCGRSAAPLVEDLAAQKGLRAYQLASLRGTRDGERFHAQALISDSSSMLTLDLRFTVGVPTTLESGEWRWVRHNEFASGSIRARSVTFLGGQDGPPGLGGSFDLLGANGSARYRVNLPVSAAKHQERPK